MNIDKYLERINYKGKTSPNLDNFKSIHRQHLYNIPFENLDIGNKVEIILDIDNLEKKIIYNNRGGYCYELNGLFYHLLKEIGYNVKMISARVSNDKIEFGPEFDHLALITELDEQWLTDVGFGDNFLEPITLTINKPQKNLNGWFKITEYENKYENEGDNNYLKLSKIVKDDVYTDEYIFTTRERDWQDFNKMNKYHQTSPDSPFTKKKVCTIAKENGRVTLTNDKLIITEGSTKKVIEVKDEKDFDKKLYEYFGRET